MAKSKIITKQKQASRKRSGFPRWIIITSVIILALMLMGKLISTQSEGDTPQQTPTMTLQDKAQKHGLVRIIVSVHVEEPPENWMGDSTLEAAHKQKIAEAQNSLLADLAPYGVKDPRKFAFIPAIAMMVNAEALQFLNTSPKVSGIETDELQSVN